MTDYSTAIFGLIAFTAVVSAAVIYVLAQPSDLPVVKKAKAAQNWAADWNNLNGSNHEHTRPTCTDCQLRYCLLRAKHLQTESRATAVKPFLRERATIYKRSPWMEIFFYDYTLKPNSLKNRKFQKYQLSKVEWTKKQSIRSSDNIND